MNSRKGASASIAGKCFFHEGRVRSGWILLLWAIVYSAMTLAAQFAFNSVPALRSWAASQPHGSATPIGSIAFTGLELIILLLSIALVTLVNKTSFRDYSLPFNFGQGWRLVLGAAAGFAMVTALVAFIAICGGISFGGLAMEGSALMKNALLYAVAFLLVGVFEELAFRGFLQSVLQRAIGFWPAAIVLSIAFAAIHLTNERENWQGLLLAALFALLASLALKRTGSLWLFIGVHAAFDWSNAFFYSLPFAGLTAQGHLMNASLHGPIWLTGGSVGPQGSVFAFVVLALAAIALHGAFPKRADQAPVLE